MMFFAWYEEASCQPDVTKDFSEGREDVGEDDVAERDSLVEGRGEDDEDRATESFTHWFEEEVAWPEEGEEGACDGEALECLCVSSLGIAGERVDVESVRCPSEE